MSAKNNPCRWDIFCRVIDNYGDAGVCLRLAKDLAARKQAVCLYIDDLKTLAALLGVDPVSPHLTLAPWPDSKQVFRTEQIAYVVIGAFACDLPEAYLQAMASSRAIWINLEYLSAESWVESHHGLPSPHPRYPLTQYFYFPGFTPKTGGLIREQAFTQHLELQKTPENKPATRPLHLFVFSYAQPEWFKWLSALHTVATPLALNIAPCPVKLDLPTQATQGLSIQHLAFVPQAEFDALLAEQDILIVRGEDSFVRAQWAAKPLIWHVYPQEDAAHLSKLKAFYDVYLDASSLSQDQRDVYWRLVCLWNGEAATQRDWSSVWIEFVALNTLWQKNALAWRQHLLKQPDLVTQLREFVSHLVK